MTEDEEYGAEEEHALLQPEAPISTTSRRRRAACCDGDSKTCIIPECTVKRKANSDGCASHETHKAVVKYQAVRDGEVASFNQIFADPQKAKRALEVVRANHIMNDKFRKKLIECEMWKKRYGVKIPYT